MFHAIRSAELPPSPRNGTRTFIGEPYAAGVSFFLQISPPGHTVVQHRHPYPETWIVRSGLVRFRSGDEEVEGHPGDVFVAEAGTAHGFHNPGPETVEMTCIHAANRMETEWLEEDV